jgi:hypothetical protein
MAGFVNRGITRKNFVEFSVIYCVFNSFGQFARRASEKQRKNKKKIANKKWPQKEAFFCKFFKQGSLPWRLAAGILLSASNFGNFRPGSFLES